MKRRYKGRFPERPTLRPATTNVNGFEQLRRVPKPTRNPTGAREYLAESGEVVDASITGGQRHWWFRMWIRGDVEEVTGKDTRGGVTAKKKASKPATSAGDTE